MFIRQKEYKPHKQLAENTGYGPIPFNPSITLASVLVQPKQLAASNNFINKLCISFMYNDRGNVSL